MKITKTLLLLFVITISQLRKQILLIRIFANMKHSFCVFVWKQLNLLLFYNNMKLLRLYYIKELCHLHMNIFVCCVVYESYVRHIVVFDIFINFYQ